MWVINNTPRPLYLWDAAAARIVQKEAVWTGVEKRKPLASSVGRIPNRPALPTWYTDYVTRTICCVNYSRMDR
jgi:hypothetical protein